VSRRKIRLSIGQLLFFIDGVLKAIEEISKSEEIGYHRYRDLSSGQIFFFITFLDSLSFSVATSDNYRATETEENTFSQETHKENSNQV
jgi:hypothetical protein